MALKNSRDIRAWLEGFFARCCTTRDCLATFAGNMANTAASMFTQQSWELRLHEVTEINDSTGGAACFSTICDFAVIWTQRATEEDAKSDGSELFAKSILKCVLPRFVLPRPKSVRRTWDEEREERVSAYPVRVVCVASV